MEATTSGSATVACITHQVPSGAATSPMPSSAATAGAVQVPGAWEAASGSKARLASPNAQGSSSSMVKRGGQRRTAAMAVAQHPAAPSSSACPSNRPGADQSMAQGPLSTTTPAIASPAATQRRGEIASRSTRRDSGTVQTRVALDRMAVRPAGTHATARCAKAKNPANCSSPSASSAGMSRRAGRRSRPNAPSTTVATVADKPARPSANQNGAAPPSSAKRVIGQLDPSSSTAPPN